MKFLSPVEKALLANLVYVALLVALFGRPFVNYSEVLFWNGLFIVGILTYARFLPMGTSQVTDFFRAGYPALVFGYFYQQTGRLMHLFFPEYLDQGLTSWEAQVFGGNVTVWLDQNFLAGGAFATFVTEALSGCYFGYYALLPGIIIPLLILRKYKQIGEILTAAAITFAVSFNLFWFYPIEGPRWFFAETYTHSINGPFFRELVQYVIENAAVRGGAMPSTHTGIAVVFLIYLYKFYRRWFYVTLPIVIGIGLGAVYGRYHYISDIVVGAAIAAVCTTITIRFYPKWQSSSN